MSNYGDMNKLMVDMMGNFSFDTVGIEKAVKKSASLNEKLANLALDAAGTSTEISTSWANETFDRFRVTAETKDEPVDYGKAMVDFWSVQTEIATKKMDLFSDVLKKAQMETVEFMVSAGKDMTKDASELVKKTTKDVTAASKKMTTGK
mgnify:CR=1 FL=1